MRRVLAVLVVLSGLVLSGCSDDVVPGPGRSSIDVDTPELRQLKRETDVAACAPGDAEAGGLPDLTLPCLGGGPDVDLASLRGPLVVNLWASWCGPCKREMPALQEFYAEYGDRVGVLGIDYQDQLPAEALELAGKVGVTYPLLADPGGDLNARDPLPVLRGLPHLVFLAEDGEISIVSGGIDSADELAELANEHLGTDL